MWHGRDICIQNETRDRVARLYGQACASKRFLTRFGRARQRVALARSLVMRPRLLLAEPLSLSTRSFAAEQFASDLRTGRIVITVDPDQTRLTDGHPLRHQQSELAQCPPSACMKFRNRFVADFWFSNIFEAGPLDAHPAVDVRWQIYPRSPRRLAMLIALRREVYLMFRAKASAWPRAPRRALSAQPPHGTIISIAPW